MYGITSCLFYELEFTINQDVISKANNFIFIKKKTQTLHTLSRLLY